MVQDPQTLVRLFFVAWVLFGVVGFMHIKGETPIDSLYLMAQIITTVGYGDPAAMMPSNDAGFIWMSCYVLMAVMVLAGFAGTAVDGLLQGQEHCIKEAVDKCMAHTGYREFGKRHPGLRKFLRAFLMWVVIVVIGIVFFTSYPGEGLGVWEALYMSVITLTTVGFGDKTPKTETGKFFATVWMLIGTAALANMATKFAAVFLEAKRKYGLSQLDTKMLDRIREDRHVEESVQNRMNLVMAIKDGKAELKRSTVAKADFQLFMLKELGMVQPWVLDQLSENFNQLDKDKSGYIDEQDLIDCKRRGSYSSSPPGSYAPPAVPPA